MYCSRLTACSLNTFQFPVELTQLTLSNPNPKTGNKKDERSLCCLLVEVKECILKKREEYCRGEIMETFRKSHNNEINYLKTNKCKHYFQSSNCEEQFEIWTLAAMVMLCLISGRSQYHWLWSKTVFYQIKLINPNHSSPTTGMACITLGILYTKK